jgi:uncharacterized membrane protein YhaH (DUF805 family)
MTFTEAVKDGFDHYVKFDGRASRPAYWWWFLFAVLVSAAANFIDYVILDTTALSGLAGLALLLPNLSVGIRRLHDANHTGWWILIGFTGIGLIVLLIFYLQQSDPAENRFGPPPATSVA